MSRRQGPRGLRGLRGPRGFAGGVSDVALPVISAFTPQHPGIWQGAPPTSLSDAVNRLSMVLYGRTVADGVLPIITADTKVLVSASDNVGQTDIIVTKYTTAGNVQWMTRIGSIASDTGRQISTDSSGNVYITFNYGSGTHPTTIFNANGSIFGILPTQIGNTDVGVVTYNTNGMCQWATQIGGANGEEGNGISADASGNVYVTGRYNSPEITIFNSNGSPFRTLANASTNNESGEAFIAKYNSNGICSWATRLSGNPGIESARSVNVDAQGNVYVTGQYSASTVTIFNANDTIFGTLPNPTANTSAAFTLKYDTNGMCMWAARMAATVTGNGLCTTVDTNGNVCVCGNYVGPLTVFNANQTAFNTLPHSGSNDAFIAKYNTDGMCQWITQIAGPTSDIANSIATDSSGNVLVSGHFGQNFDSALTTIFNSNGTTFRTLVQTGDRDTFLIKYDTNGMGLWFTRVIGNGDQDGRAVAVDAQENVYLALANTFFEPSGCSIFNADGSLFSQHNGSALIKYSAQGQCSWKVRFPFSALNGGISVDTNGNIYTLGASNVTPLILRSAGL